ncbi:MAG: hypothetical protein OXT64_14980, partial [Gammaproteobacteria bacterium]|nr:hypothetical protein [Gammaproteobacteria bacterium]
AHGEVRNPDEVIAVVLGQEITVEDARGSPITSLIGDPLMEKFAEDNDVQPTEEELTQFAEGMLGMQQDSLSELENRRAELEKSLDGTLGAEERKETEAHLESVVTALDSMSQTQWAANTDVVRSVAVRWVQRWKILNALYEEYGGRVIFQQAGFEPFDAVRDFLEEREDQGDFTILDQDYEDEFWQYWRKDPLGVVPEEKANELMRTPVWLMERPVDY